MTDLMKRDVTWARKITERLRAQATNYQEAPEGSRAAGVVRHGGEPSRARVGRKQRVMTVDPFREHMRRERNAVIAQAIRDGLVFVLIVHAVVTVLFSPRRYR